MTEQWVRLADQLLSQIVQRFEAQSRFAPVKGQASAVFFADLCDSSKFWRHYGEVEGYQRIQFHNWVCRRVVESANGTIVKELGDGLLATFSDVSIAFQAGLCLIWLWENLSQKVTIREPIKTRVAITRGQLFPVTSSPGDFVGEAIIKCLQIAGHAQPNHLVLDEPVREELASAKNLDKSLSVEPKVVTLPDLGAMKIYEVAAEYTTERSRKGLTSK